MPAPRKANRIVSIISSFEAPSDLAICGRYVFKPTIFDYIEKTAYGKGGERQLTDAIKNSRSGGKIAALQLAKNERRYDGENNGRCLR